MNEQVRTADHITTIDCLRGIAALAVCCCHLLAIGAWKSTVEYGWLGVYVFFVVSGFIVPYSLARGGYALAAYPRFLAKRIARLDPPYLVSIALTILLHYISYQFPQFKGQPPHYTVPQVLLHLGYLNSFFGGNWILIVYWTLGIEFQYYLIVGLIYPLLISKRLLAQAALLALCAIGMGRYTFPLHVKADQGPLIFHYAFVFMLGVLAFRFKIELIDKRTYLIMATLTAVAASACCGPVIGITSLITSLTIAFVTLRSRVLAWSGSISYSLYLVHYPIGGRVFGIGERLFQSPLLQYAAHVASVLVSILVAYVMYRLVEQPAKRFASRIRLRTVVRPSSSGDEVFVAVP
jgi:peptidoglycan/LPS O-acetylase OafA/YrhL